MSQHKKFICAPISNILKQAILATKNIGYGIETFPLFDYIMQSTFLQMTGAQEQKMKCLMWEMAHNDLTFRYNFMKETHGEYSLYKDKKRVYKGLIEQIKSVRKDFDTNDLPIDKQHILRSSNISEYLENSTIVDWSKRLFVNYQRLWGEITIQHFSIKNSPKDVCTALLGSQEIWNKISLKNLYEDYLYDNRNRIAHNTKSYQYNLPTLNKLKDENFIYENYFLWFSVLILIDHVFIELYEIYLKTLEQRKFL